MLLKKTVPIVVGVVVAVVVLIIAFIIFIAYFKLRNKRTQNWDRNLIKSNVEMKSLVRQASLQNVKVFDKVDYSSVKGVGISFDQNSAHRRTMEDEHVVLDKFGDSLDQGYFAVFDGHGGNEVSDFASKNLHKNLLSELNNCSEYNEMREKKGNYLHPTIAKAIQKAFLSIDDQLKENKIDKAGSTAVVAFLTKKPKDGIRMLYVADIGDTRAVLARGNVAVRLSFDHKATDPSEAERIKADSGWIVQSKVAGILSVTRAFGNMELKQWVLADPYISETELKPEDTHLIIACDGLWDVASDQEAVDLILKESGASPQSLSDKLLRYALDNKTRDNVSVLVIRL